MIIMMIIIMITVAYTTIPVSQIDMFYHQAPGSISINHMFVHIYQVLVSIRAHR